MSYTQKKLSEVELLTEVPENATVFAEVNGEIKRVPGKGLGGSGNGLVLVQDVADSADPEPMVTVTPVFYTFTTNMTLEEAMELFTAYELSSVAVYMPMNTTSPKSTDSTSNSSSMMLDYAFAADESSYAGQNCLVFNTLQSGVTIYWTAEGASTEEPSNGSVE